MKRFKHVITNICDLKNVKNLENSYTLTRKHENDKLNVNF